MQRWIFRPRAVQLHSRHRSLPCAARTSGWPLHHPEYAVPCEAISRLVPLFNPVPRETMLFVPRAAAALVVTSPGDTVTDDGLWGWGGQVKGAGGVPQGGGRGILAPSQAETVGWRHRGGSPHPYRRPWTRTRDACGVSIKHPRLWGDHRRTSHKCPMYYCADFRRVGGTVLLAPLPLLLSVSQSTPCRVPARSARRAVEAWSSPAVPSALVRYAAPTPSMR